MAMAERYNSIIPLEQKSEKLREQQAKFAAVTQEIVGLILNMHELHVGEASNLGSIRELLDGFKSTTRESDQILEKLAFEVKAAIEEYYILETPALYASPNFFV